MIEERASTLRAYLLPVALMLAPGAVALASFSVRPLEYPLVIVSISALNLILLYVPRAVQPDDPRGLGRGPGRVSLRLITIVAVASYLLFPLDATRPFAAALTALFGLYVAVLMIRSGDPWSVPQRPPTKPPWAKDR